MNIARVLRAGALLLPLVTGSFLLAEGPARGKALVIGVSKYDTGWDTLRADQDIDQVEAALSPYYDVTPLPNASHDDIEEALATLLDASAKTPEAPILVYFAGHGHNIGDVGYIVPRDAPPPTNEASRRLFNRKAIAIEELVIWARRFPAAQALFVFDSCFSGSILQAVRGMGDEDEPSGNPAQPVRAFLTSGAADQKVPDKSRFLKSFLHALEGRADSRPDCVITSDEVAKYIDKQFSGPDSTQTPLYGKLGTERFDKTADFVIIPKLGSCTPQVVTPPVVTQPSRPMTAEEARWLIAETATRPEEILEYMRAYPAGVHIIEARTRFKSVARESDAYFISAMNSKARNDWREAAALFNAAIALKPEHGGYVRVTGSIRHRYIPFYWLALALQNLDYCDAAKLAANEAKKKGALAWTQPKDMDRIIAKQCPAPSPSVASRTE